MTNMSSVENSIRAFKSLLFNLAINLHISDLLSKLFILYTFVLPPPPPDTINKPLIDYLLSQVKACGSSIYVIGMLNGCCKTFNVLYLNLWHINNIIIGALNVEQRIKNKHG